MRFENRRPVALMAVALTFGTTDTPGEDTMRAALLREALRPALEDSVLPLDDATPVSIFPAAGPGGPAAHSGLTGRKSADDAYGSFVRRGGPALSGKDPGRVDRIAPYAARQAARAVVTAGLARECEVQLSYISGEEAPVSVEVDTYATGMMTDQGISAGLRAALDFRPGAIAERMGLWDLPGARSGRFYRDLASFGHMGRDALSPPWEDVTEIAERLG